MSNEPNHHHILFFYIVSVTTFFAFKSDHIPLLYHFNNSSIFVPKSDHIPLLLYRFHKTNIFCNESGCVHNPFFDFRRRRWFRRCNEENLMGLINALDADLCS
ncbi:Uncharacterized protein Rs2_28588 [Raphanus sativus]|nr:Uncharacterized protein Rs2_28588 [Raphanus sativus]